MQFFCSYDFALWCCVITLCAQILAAFDQQACLLLSGLLGGQQGHEGKQLLIVQPKLAATEWLKTTEMKTAELPAGRDWLDSCYTHHLDLIRVMHG